MAKSPATGLKKEREVSPYATCLVDYSSLLGVRATRGVGWAKRVKGNSSVLSVQSKTRRRQTIATVASFAVGAGLVVAALAAPSVADTQVPLVTADSTITTVAGQGVAGFSGDGGPATAALINQPRDTDFGPDGSLYIADTFNHRIRRVAPDGTITTVAGTGNTGYNGDGQQATQAALYWPHDVLVDDAGVIYIADSAHHRIRRVGPDGVISTIAGTGKGGFSGDNGQATAAKLKNPKGLALFDGKLYIADGNNNRIRMIDLATGIITTVAGTGVAGFSGDGGPATAAKLDYPQRVDVDPLGRIYVADSDNHAIRRFTPGGTITTVAGTGVAGFSGDGGQATKATLRYPRGVGVVGTEALYIADSNNHRVRLVDLATGIITTVAGTGKTGYSGDNGPAGAARLYNPRGVTIDAQGNVYVADAFNSAIRLIAAPVVETGPNTPPVASFTSECAGARCSFDATGSTDPDGSISSYDWDFGDGASGAGRTSTHTYANDSTFDVTLTVTDNRGDSTSTTHSVVATNQAPAADFSVTCHGLTCGLDASASSDVDGSIASYDWDLGDGSTSTGRLTSHTYATEGDYSVTLTVTDDRGASSQATGTASATTPVASAIAFRAADSVGGATSANPTVTIPSSVADGDTLLLFVSNGSSRTPSVPAGWNALATETDVELRTDVYWRRATASDAGQSLQVLLLNSSGAPQIAPNTVTIAAYSGVLAPPVSAFASGIETSDVFVGDHTTPDVTVPTEGSWVVSYWADRTSNTAWQSATNSWTAPAGQQVRSDAYNTASGGRVTSLLTDDGSTSSVGPRQGLTATADGNSKKATLWSIVLRGS